MYLQFEGNKDIHLTNNKCCFYLNLMYCIWNAKSLFLTVKIRYFWLFYTIENMAYLNHVLTHTLAFFWFHPTDNHLKPIHD